MLRRYMKIKGDMPLFSGGDRGQRFACCCPADKLTSFISHYLLLSPPIY